MRKFFYKVTYQKENNGGNFDLGIFSTKTNAQKKIDSTSKNKGFEDIECFKVVKFGVDFTVEIDKRKVKLYSVAHEYSIEEEGEIYDIINIFGIYSSKTEAMSHLRHLKKHSRIGRKYPDNFIVFQTKVDNYLYWSEGYDAY